MRVACLLLAVVGFAAGCGSGTADNGSARSGGVGEVRLAGIELRKRLTAGDAVRLAREYELTTTEVKAVYRYGDEENSLGYLPEPHMTPEEVDREFRKESAFEEVMGQRDSGFTAEQRRALDEAQRAVERNEPAVEELTVCGPRDSLFELESDPRVKAMFLAPKHVAVNCPQGLLDSDS
ncbi:MAG: hypothetical protein M3238_02905 [Actinomycetota bacterium]|nr:hypothetical protein [Actinomycetota bacterium]